MKGLTFTLANLQKVFDGTKTMTRRMHKKPRLKVGDKFCIREPLVKNIASSVFKVGAACYELDGVHVLKSRGECWLNWAWKRDFLPAMFMPDCAARRFGIITSVKQERLNSIALSDIFKEGYIEPTPESMEDEAIITAVVNVLERRKAAYNWWAELWDSIYGEKPGCSWTDNPSPCAYGWEMC